MHSSPLLDGTWPGRRRHPADAIPEQGSSAGRIGTRAQHVLQSAAADLPFGGGKSVIWGEGDGSRETLYRLHAEMIERLDGRYIAVRTSEPRDLTSQECARVTRFVAGVTDAATWTARGVLRGIQAAAMHRLERIGIEGNLVIDRRDFGITLSRIAETGAIVVGNDVRIELDVEFGRRTAPASP
jgi:hypothetical protein